MISIEAIFIERIICARCFGMMPASRRGAGKEACHGCSSGWSCWVVVIVSGLGRLVCCVVKGGEILEGLDEDLG
jgi:hypothetical protein